MDVIWTAEFANAGWLEPWAGKERSRSPRASSTAWSSRRRSRTRCTAAPFTSNTQLLWYRTDRVNKAPKTWDEMIVEAEKIGPRAD